MTQSAKDIQAIKMLVCLLFAIGLVFFSYLAGEAVGAFFFNLSH